jgi:transposase
VEEKRRIMELTLVPGASVAGVAQAEGVNANQVFLWRRAYQNCEMLPADSTTLLPVMIEAEDTAGADITSVPDVVHGVPEQLFPGSPSNAIHIEFPGRAAISVERGADHALLRTILESLCR